MKELMIYVADHQTDLMLFLQGICTVLAFLTLLPKNLSKRRRTAILLLEINSVLYLAANRMYFLWMSVDHSDMIFELRAVKFLDYFFGFTMIACMNFYLKDLFTQEARLDRHPARLKVIDITLLIAVALLVISQFTDLYYGWDANNDYYRGSFYYVNYIFPFITIILQLSCVIHHYSRFSRSIRVPITICIVLPMIMIAAQLLSGGEIRGAVLSTVGISIVLYVFSIQEMNRTVDRAHKLEIEMMENYQKELETTVDKLTQELRVANEKAEHLLHNIFPENVARELAEDPDKTISMRYPNATVLFTDVVDFTALTGNMTAEETVTMLNRMITMFDERAEREGIEKIKTVGDAYMAASGLTDDADNDGAYRMVHFAKGLLQDIEEFNKTAAFPIQIRIGINTGELVAGVIGKNKFIYDIWGDTVNVASRMESTGSPMKIHITKSTYEQVKDRYTYIEKVTDEIKGKGQMRGYYV